MHTLECSSVVNEAFGMPRCILSSLLFNSRLINSSVVGTINFAAKDLMDALPSLQPRRKKLALQL